MRPRDIEVFTACVSLLLAWPGTSSAQTQRQHGAHVHGVTTMEIAQDGRQLSVTVEMPGMNAMGFEHPPHTVAEQAQLDAALNLLHKPSDWFSPNAEARCRLTNVEVTPNGFGGSASDAGAKPSENETANQHDHTDVDSAYQFECDAPLNLRSVDLRLIERFPGTHEVRVNIVSLSGQAQEVFSTPRAEITFAPAAL
jgi:hypothetical protein